MSTSSPTPDAPTAGAAMSHRAVLTALSGLLLGMFVAILSSTVVSTALPRIVADLEGTQSGYTWVVTSTLLALTVSTPIWGKLADLVDRKTLLQLSLVIFTLGSIVAGFAQSMGWLIACRAVQGLGAGGLTALVQVVLSDLVSARERGRYMGYLGAVMAVGTVGGPLLGGIITDASSWRFTFFVGVPFAVAALVVLQRTLHLPARRGRDVHLDVPGALLISGGVSLLLVWVSLAGKEFAWGAWQTPAMVGLGVVALIGAVVVERRSREPLIPTHLFADRNVVLTVIASIAVGVAMFGASVFLSQYFQIARDKTALQAGLLTIPMVAGIFLSSTGIGRLVSRVGRYKAFMVGGALTMTVAFALMSTIDASTSLVLVGVFLFLVGSGVGAVMQNLVLVVQNSVDVREVGAGSALVAFTRSLGGAAGVAALGALLSSHVTTAISDGLRAAGVPSGAGGAASSGTVPDVDALPASIRPIVESAYADGIAQVFLVAAPLALIAVIALLFLREAPLGEKTGTEMYAEREAAEAEDRREPVLA